MSVDFVALSYKQLLALLDESEKHEEQIRKLTELIDAVKSELENPPESSYLHFVREWVKNRRQEEEEKEKWK